MDKTLAELIDEILPRFKRENRAVSTTAVCKYISEHFKELAGNFVTPVTGDAIQKQVAGKNNPTEDVVTAISELHNQLCCGNKTIELKPSRPETDYDIEDAREMFEELVEIYGSGVGKLVNKITKGRIKPATANSLRKKTKKSCSKTLGNALTKLLKLSKLKDGMAQKGVFEGVMLPDSEGEYRKVIKISDYRAYLKTGETVPMGYPSNKLRRRLAEIIDSKSHLTEMRVKGLLMAAIPYDNDVWRKAFKGGSYNVPSTATTLLDNMRDAEAFTQERDYMPLDAVILPKEGLVVVTNVSDDHIKVVRPGKRYMNIHRQKV